jgi:hypothetical protein
MSRKDLENLARRALYSASPDMTRETATRLISGGPFQDWMSEIERKRPRGFVAWVRRLRGKERGITPEQAARVQEIAQKTVERFGR